jgi:hypothetical protein
MSGMEVVGLGMGLVGTMMQSSAQSRAGKEQARAARFEAGQLEEKAREQEINASIERTRADQQTARRTEDLNDNLETIAAIRAGRGVGTDSPTGRAIREGVSADERQDIGIERGSILNEADAWRRGAWASRQEAGMARRKAKYSIWAGNTAAATTIVTGIGRAASGRV